MCCSLSLPGSLRGWGYNTGALARFLTQDAKCLSRFVWQVVGARERAPLVQHDVELDNLSSSDSDV